MCKIIIEGFMTTELGLNGNQLVLFAILWGESKKGVEAVADNYAKYSGLMNTTIPTYYNTAKKLEERGVIRKTDDGKWVLAARI